MSDWKNVQYKDGKYRTSEGGGGGDSSTFAGLDDVSLNNLQNGQVPKYNSTTQKWENADESGGGGTVTDVQVDGVSVVNQQGVAEIEMPTPPTIPVEDVKVNGESVVDGNKEAQIKSYKEVTQAEYNALPDSKLNDGILYCIKDTGGADGFPPLIYSDEEREIGVWRDGKPLYQKTINFGSLPNHELKTVAHGIQNLDRIVNYSAVTKNGTGTTYFPLSRANDNTQYIIDIYFSNTDINIVTYGDRTAHSVYVTLQYTKTTDTAGSGTWTIQGGYAHHYSTSEKVIGTWIDGKPLYEKTVTFGNIPAGTNNYTIQMGLSNVDNVIENNGMGYDSANNSYFRLPLVIIHLPYSDLQKYSATIQTYNKSADTVRIDTGSERPIAGGYITIRYTKTTD